MTSHTPIRSRFRLGTSLVLTSLLVMSCGGNPAGAPGQGAANLPPQTNPAVKDGDKDKNAQKGPTRNLAGTITDALTGEPVGKVTVFVQGLTTTVPSTPIPPASPEPQGGGGGPFTVAQAAESPEADADMFGPSPTPEGSPDPFASTDPFASPNASPEASVSPEPGATAPGGAGAGPTPTGKEQAGVPTASSTPYPLQAVKVDSKGKFELKDLPEGTYNVTFWAPGYQAETFQGNLPTEIEVKLRPLAMPTKNLHDLKGVVRQANNQPAAGIAIEASSLRGQVPGVRELSDDQGAFGLAGLLPGNYAVAAWTTNMEGEIDTFAMVKEVPVAVGRERRSVSPTLVLRAVTAPVLLAGTIEGTITEEEEKAAKAAKKVPEGVRPQSVRVFLRVDQGEIPLLTHPVAKDGYFRLRLPALPEGASYHLVAAGQSETGQTVYLHRYGLTESDPKLALQLLDAPGALTVDERTESPRFSWEAKDSETSAYRVSLESIGDNADTIWQGWTTGTSIQLPASKDLTLLKAGESYRVSLTAVKLAEDGKLDLARLNAQDWLASGLAKPVTFEVQRLKPGQKPSSTAPVKPLASGAPKASPAPAASASPRKNQRIKPLDTL